MDEIFGEENFIASVIWQKKYATANDHQGIAPMHDYLIVFCKTNEFKRNLLPRTEKNDGQYRYKDGQGVFRISDYTCNKSADERPNLYYPVVNPNRKYILKKKLCGDIR
jgi:adenine specific DNA methylase Mod